MYIPLEDGTVLDGDDVTFVGAIVPVKHCE